MVEFSLADFPPGFVERYETILGPKIDKFLEWLARPLRPSIRVNTLKTSPEELVERLENEYGLSLEKFPWLDYGFYIGTQNPGATLEHAAGFYYVQSDSSMIPVKVLCPEVGELVLDISAAPGSKTTQACQEMRNTGGILANDTSRSRISVLSNNVKRFGCLNVRVRLGDGRRIPGRDIFDKALVDAPCSGESSIARVKGAKGREGGFLGWNPRRIEKLAALQKALLASAVRLTKPGGAIVYSTCTFEPKENEGVVDWALDALPVKLEGVKIPDLPSDKGLQGYKCKNDVIRIWPWLGMEGFFVAKLVKEAG